MLINLQGRAAIEAGHHVLINGAAGAVGSVALQVAKARGARVTAVDSAEKLDLLGDLGADEVVDYRQADPTEGEPRYDLRAYPLDGVHQAMHVLQEGRVRGRLVLAPHALA